MSVEEENCWSKTVPPIIGICASGAYAGKDTTKDFIQELDPRYVQVAFSDGLRERVEIITKGQIKAKDTKTSEGKAVKLSENVFGQTKGELASRMCQAFQPLVFYKVTPFQCMIAVETLLHQGKISWRKWLYICFSLNRRLQIVSLFLSFFILIFTLAIVFGFGFGFGFGSQLTFPSLLSSSLSSSLFLLNDNTNNNDSNKDNGDSNILLKKDSWLVFQLVIISSIMSALICTLYVKYWLYMDICDEPIRNVDMTVGRLLQILGTDVGRCIFDQCVWIEALNLTWHSMLRINPHARIIITDVRFIDEMAWVKAQRNNCLILVDSRMRTSRSKILLYNADGRSNTHASELGLTEVKWHDFDLILNNNGNLLLLKDQISVFFFFHT